MFPSHFDESRVRQRLEVELDIAPPESCSCDAGASGGEVLDIEGICVNGERHVDLAVPSSEQCCPDEDGGCVVHGSADIDANCPFQAFYDQGWVPRIESVGDDHVRVQTYLPDREALSGIIDVLKRTADAFQVRRLTHVDVAEDGTEEATKTLDLTGLTEKQRRTALRAVESGYYETPRETSFASLAEQMDLSKSALSRRLSAVEAAVMKAAFSGTSTPTSA